MGVSAHTTNDTLYHFHATTGPAATITGYPFTMSTWIRVDAGGASDSIMGLTDASGSGAGTNSWQIIYRDIAANVGFRLTTVTSEGTQNTSDYDTGHAEADGTWFHVVGTFRSATDRELYVDGVSRATDTGTATFSQPNTIGWSIGASGNLADGYCSYMCLYNAALSVDEVNEIRFKPLALPKNLIWCIPCSQIAYGATASNYIDISGNGWNCTSAGAAVASDDGPPIFLH